MYKIIKEKSLQTLERTINSKCKIGLSPIGGLIKVEEDGNTMYAQAMVKINHVSPLSMHPIVPNSYPRTYEALNSKRLESKINNKFGTLSEFELLADEGIKKLIVEIKNSLYNTMDSNKLSRPTINKYKIAIVIDKDTEKVYLFVFINNEKSKYFVIDDTDKAIFKLLYTLNQEETFIEEIVSNSNINLERNASYEAIEDSMKFDFMQSLDKLCMKVVEIFKFDITNDFNRIHPEEFGANYYNVIFPKDLNIIIENDYASFSMGMERYLDDYIKGPNKELSKALSLSQHDNTNELEILVFNLRHQHQYLKNKFISALEDFTAKSFSDLKDDMPDLRIVSFSLMYARDKNKIITT